MCIDVYRRVHGHVYRHMYQHVHGHVHRACAWTRIWTCTVYRQVHGHVYRQVHEHAHRTFARCKNTAAGACTGRQPVRCTIPNTRSPLVSHLRPAERSSLKWNQDRGHVAPSRLSKSEKKLWLLWRNGSDRNEITPNSRWFRKGTCHYAAGMPESCHGSLSSK